MTRRGCESRGSVTGRRIGSSVVAEAQVCFRSLWRPSASVSVYLGSGIVLLCDYTANGTLLGQTHVVRTIHSCIYKPVMARALACLRFFLVGGAIIVGICGLVESLFAGYFVYQFHEYPPLTPGDVCGPPGLLLAMGLLVCVVGWCAWQFLDFTNRGQVIIFAIVLSIITIIETSAGIWALVRHEQVDALSSLHLNHVFKTAVTDDKSVWDRMQSRLRCCAVDGPTDYRGQDAIPWSCCDMTPVLNASDSKGTCTSVYARGCHHVVINRTRSILLHVFLLALCTVLLQVLFITCMICYARACKEKRARRNEVQKNNLFHREPRYSKTPCDAES